ncbi:hypothetical protein EVAR_48315_1 [Eumeta japonica]|uniref:Uncharacterized protein n=1 Tax=Eumeta variegata TaxID=151549 RepID=A0A4C1WMH9_EUMVA|nr:hypothetical protein EVAR_48315_1 [Eumeta japonica]
MLPHGIADCIPHPNIVRDGVSGVVRYASPNAPFVCADENLMNAVDPIKTDARLSPPRLNLLSRAAG